MVGAATVKEQPPYILQSARLNMGTASRLWPDDPSGLSGFIYNSMKKWKF